MWAATDGGGALGAHAVGMSSTAAAPTPHAGGSSHWGPASVLGVITGSLVALVALGLAVAGLAAVVVHLAARDADGFVTTDTRTFTTPTYALTVEEVQLGDMHGGAGDWAVEELGGKVRVHAALAGSAPVFVGIAHERDLQTYLGGVAHDEIRDFGQHASTPLLRTRGTDAPARPATRGFWVASATGRGEQTAEWDVSGGRWGAVVMRADARRGVDADVSAGAKLDWLLWAGVGLLAAGAIAFAGGVALVTVAGRHATGGPSGGAGATTMTAAVGGQPAPASPAVGGSSMTAVLSAPEAVGSYPVTVRAELHEPLSRWLWLVKWALAIPHLIVLAFLGVAFVFTSIAGIIGVVATGRYPRGLFDFNAGVLRWFWRVEFYANGAYATDRYPPFSLEPDPSYPADLDIPYPEGEQPRLRTAFQWLLAAPHWLILGALVGGSWWLEDLRVPGLLPMLVIIAVLALLFTGRYPRELFRLVVGIHRWALRVGAYAAGMRPEYPPFTLER